VKPWRLLLVIGMLLLFLAACAPESRAPAGETRGTPRPSSPTSGISSQMPATPQGSPALKDAETTSPDPKKTVQATLPTCGAGPNGCQKLAELATTVVIGKVVSPEPDRQRREAGPESKGIVFEDWVLQVERYIIHPQPFDLIEVRVFVAAVTGGGLLPLKEPRLKAGERVLLFLWKWDGYSLGLQSNEFTIPALYSWGDTFLISGKLAIRDGKARNATSTDAPWEPLELIIEAVRKHEKGQQIAPPAKQGGLALSPPADGKWTLQRHGVIGHQHFGLRATP